MKKTIIIVLAIVGVLALTCVGAVVVGGAWLANNAGPPEGVTISVVSPPTVEQGKNFDVVVTVTDTSGKDRVIEDIDFYEPLHDGITMVSVTPRMQGLDAAFGAHTYTMKAPVPANGSATVTFTFTADTPGTYYADLDTSIDSIMRIHTTPTTIIITPRP